MEYRFLRIALPASTLLFLAAFLSACSLFGDGIGADALEIHLQSSFQGERVQVDLDGRRVYDAPVVTDHRIGLADVIHLERAEGVHRIEVTVDGRHRAARAFELKDHLFVGILFSERAIPEAGVEAGVRLRFSDIGFVYD